MPVITVDDGDGSSLHYEDTGPPSIHSDDYLTVVFLHGLGINGSKWSCPLTASLPYQPTACRNISAGTATGRELSRPIRGGQLSRIRRVVELPSSGCRGSTEWSEGYASHCHREIGPRARCFSVTLYPNPQHPENLATRWQTCRRTSHRGLVTGMFNPPIVSRARTGAL